jgi:hypothetical protein
MKLTPTHIEAAIQAPVGSDLPDPGTKIIQKEGWYQIINPSVPVASANGIVISRVLPSECEKRVDEAFASYREFLLPFKWSIGPMSSPTALQARISKLAEKSWLFRGMVADTALQLSVPENIVIEPVTSANIHEFIAVNLHGWGHEMSNPQAKARLVRFVAAQNYRGYLARLDGNAVGAALTCLKEGYGYLLGAIVLSESRGKGIYRALTQARLGDLQKLEMRYAVTQAREATSAPVLEKIGFETAFHARIYQFGAGT